MTRTTYIPLERSDIERQLGRFLDRLRAALRVEPFATTVGTEVGHQLVDGHFTGPDSLGRTTELLGPHLLDDPELATVDQLPRKVVALLGELAAGYAVAMREQVLDRQEQLKRALLSATNRAENDLRERETRDRELFAGSAFGLAIGSMENEIEEVNAAFAEMLGTSPHDLVGLNLLDLLHPEETTTFRELYIRLVAGEIPRIYEYARFNHPAGEPVWGRISATLLRNFHGQARGLVAWVEDVTDHNLLQEEFSRQTLHDVLTGLPNRQFLLSHLERVLGRCEHDDLITLCHVGLDGLTVVNHGLGHQAGDLLLSEVGNRLISAVAGERAMVARLGGDEFAVLIENTEQTPDAGTLCAVIAAELTEPAYYREHGLAVSACIGIVQRIAGHTVPTELLRDADITLHRTKSTGNGQWNLFDSRQDEVHREHYRLAASMPGALEMGEIRVEYQPLARVADGEVMAVEALLTWEHPEVGPLDHAQCLSLANETGLIMQLGGWLLDEACRQGLGWQREFEDAPPLLINLTADQACDPDLLRRVHRLLDETGFAAEKLWIGFPANAVSQPDREGTENAQLLRELGIVILLSEFGVSYLDLHSLKMLPDAPVRVSNRLLAELAADPCEDSVTSFAITGIVQLLQQAGRTTMVGEIRTAAQTAWATEVKADIAQGPYLMPCTDAASITQALRDR
ncbi:putative bifunctional diguanylate cyclase/phosphodiesterase [Actinoalloteichus hymeniacidonis]|uniref:PAS domain S-box/diguanylate cyclase (GGDEF) domain-containing protein n=1 Tax=Actinoalloteichus hymeniacidonis TaxID=340345 RepID=A0AAC9HMW7_9PSEU|nr:EAL domain-containing protein [Actinoalloteichus hymeniacidonis]AOS62107.1 PAS domain S-box/diguanylate cyclase (GGDEF) domain-containing protein [Actinoalloteichus hymeniacidonis]MBB5909871.1 diguanylate cyclase (GGDEF)-like protein/PAS domain S-box-containing protein [Actinoalloteichus hymeniacidonis]